MSEICIGVYYPLKFKLRTHKEYPIIVEGEQNFDGLRARYRSLQLIKNRQGESEKAVAMNFFGELGYWKELPKAKDIQDWTKYLSLNKIKQEKEDEISTKDIVEIKQPLTYSF